MFQNILVGVDGSESAIKAVTVAATLSKSFGAQLILTHVVQVSAIAEQAINMSATEHLKENPKTIMEKLSQEVLGKAREHALQAGVADGKITTVTKDGNQTRELIKAAEDCKADLIVVGSKGRGRLEGLLLGSVSQKVAALAPCPCLVV
ncbi:MAG: universal stress protein [Kiloniellales bacterium]|nr:universal stress protein [Kiloniellales bacterium]